MLGAAARAASASPRQQPVRYTHGDEDGQASRGGRGSTKGQGKMMPWPVAPGHPFLLSSFPPSLLPCLLPPPFLTPFSAPSPVSVGEWADSRCASGKKPRDCGEGGRLRREEGKEGGRVRREEGRGEGGREGAREGGSKGGWGKVVGRTSRDCIVPSPRILPRLMTRTLGTSSSSCTQRQEVEGEKMCVYTHYT